MPVLEVGVWEKPLAPPLQEKCLSSAEDVPLRLGCETVQAPAPRRTGEMDTPGLPAPAAGGPQGKGFARWTLDLSGAGSLHVRTLQGFLKRLSRSLGGRSSHQAVSRVFRNHPMTSEGSEDRHRG